MKVQPDFSLSLHGATSWHKIRELTCSSLLAIGTVRCHIPLEFLLVSNDTWYICCCVSSASNQPQCMNSIWIPPPSTKDSKDCSNADSVNRYHRCRNVTKVTKWQYLEWPGRKNPQNVDVKMAQRCTKSDWVRDLTWKQRRQEHIMCISWLMYTEWGSTDQSNQECILFMGFEPEIQDLLGRSGDTNLANPWKACLYLDHDPQLSGGFRPIFTHLMHFDFDVKHSICLHSVSYVCG